MININNYSFLLLEEIPLEELSQGVSEIVGDFRNGDLNMDEAMNLIEEEFKDEIIQWAQTNNELSEIFPSEPDEENQ